VDGRPANAEGGRSGLSEPGLVAREWDQGPRWTSARWGVTHYLSLERLEN